MNSERNPMSSIQCLDANQLIPDDQLSLYGLLARVSDYSQDDPVHSTEGLYRGIDIAHRTFEFPVAALALLYRHRRPAFIAALSEQITNAYRVHEPASGLGLLATLVFATESNCWTASAHIVESLNGAGVLNPESSPLHQALARLGRLFKKGAAPVGAGEELSDVEFASPVPHRRVTK
jgi:hypothetical protein